MFMKYDTSLNYYPFVEVIELPFDLDFYLLTTMEIHV